MECFAPLVENHGEMSQDQTLQNINIKDQEENA